jgi:hypothetical protein
MGKRAAEDSKNENRSAVKAAAMRMGIEKRRRQKEKVEQ